MGSHSKRQQMLNWMSTSSCAGFAARLFGEAAEDDGPDHASEQLLAVAASITKAGDKLHPLTFQQASRSSGPEYTSGVTDPLQACSISFVLCNIYIRRIWMAAGAILPAVAERPAVACQPCRLQCYHFRQFGSCCSSEGRHHGLPAAAGVLCRPAHLCCCATLHTSSQSS